MSLIHLPKIIWFSSPLFQKRVKHRKCCLVCRRIWLFYFLLQTLLRTLWDMLFTLHSFWHMCYPCLLKWYATIAILCCYHNPQVDGDKWCCTCFSCVALGRYLLQCLDRKLGWPHDCPGCKSELLTSYLGSKPKTTSLWIA